MDPGCSDRGQRFPFPCQLRSKHQDTGGYFSSMSGPTNSAVELKISISEKRKKACPPPTLLLPLLSTPPRPLSSYLHYAFLLFMLGRNCGCSWWFEVRRDWPRVTLNKYTRTSQEGAGRLRLPPNHPWLISWQIQGDFLCTLPTATVPSPNQPPLPPLSQPMEGDGIRAAQTGWPRQPGRWSVATRSCLCHKETRKYTNMMRECTLP